MLPPAHSVISAVCWAGIHIFGTQHLNGSPITALGDDDTFSNTTSGMTDLKTFRHRKRKINIIGIIYRFLGTNEESGHFRSANCPLSRNVSKVNTLAHCQFFAIYDV